MPMNENADPPVGLARSGGTRSKAGSNYGDWSPNRPQVQAGVPARSYGDRGYNPVGMAYKGPRDAADVAQLSAAAVPPTVSAAVGSGGSPNSPSHGSSFVRWWNRLKSLFQADHGASEAPPHRPGAAVPPARSSASDDTL